MNVTLLKRGCINHQKGEELLIYQQQHHAPSSPAEKWAQAFCATWPVLAVKSLLVWSGIKRKIISLQGPWGSTSFFHLHVFSRFSAVLVLWLSCDPLTINQGRDLLSDTWAQPWLGMWVGLSKWINLLFFKTFLFCFGFFSYSIKCVLINLPVFSLPNGASHQSFAVLKKDAVTVGGIGDLLSSQGKP